jgi:phospholipase C
VVTGFARFQADAASGNLAAFSYIEPEWATYPHASDPPDVTQADDEHNFQVENDQHPVSNLAVGEKLLYDVYQALRNGPGWGKTLLIITYDEHGGTYDHVHPPTGAIPPDGIIGTSDFDFTRSRRGLCPHPGHSPGRRPRGLRPAADRRGPGPASRLAPGRRGPELLP